MDMKTDIKQAVAILYGGRSGEHEVSLLSAASVVRHIPLPPEKLVLIGISHDGVWHLQPDGTVEAVRAGAPLSITDGDMVAGLPGTGLVTLRGGKTVQLKLDIVFPVLHGTFGEDGTLQGMLEMLDLPYVGSGVLGSALGMDKAKVKSVWQDAGLPIVPFRVLHRHEFKTGGEFALWDRLASQFQPPFFVKPARGGSSVGISRACNPPELLKAVELAFGYDTKLVIEPSVNAREIEVSVTGNESPTASVPGEVIPTHAYYDYEAKYLDPEGARFRIPAELDEEQTTLVRELAVRAYAAAEAAGLSRVDFFLDKSTGQLVLNEINTMPGFTSISMFPKMVEASGTPYPNLIMRLIALGQREWAARHALRFAR